MPFTPRDMRACERLHRARVAAQDGAAHPLAAALAQIGTAFDEASSINAFKLRIERWVQLGPLHAAVRARFGARAALLQGRDLDAAIGAVERWWRSERTAFEIASAFGYGTRLSLEILRELRLILRLLRFRRRQSDFGALIAALCEAPKSMAAE